MTPAEYRVKITPVIAVGPPNKRGVPTPVDVDWSTLEVDGVNGDRLVIIVCANHDLASEVTRAIMRAGELTATLTETGTGSSPR